LKYENLLLVLIVALFFVWIAVLNDDKITGQAATPRLATLPSSNPISACSDGTQIGSCNSKGQKCQLSQTINAVLTILADDMFAPYLNGQGIQREKWYGGGGWSDNDARGFQLGTSPFSGYKFDLVINNGDVLQIAAGDRNKGEGKNRAGLIAELTVDGKQILKTDDSWKMYGVKGPELSYSVDWPEPQYLGQTYTKWQPLVSWLAPSFDDSKWQNADASFKRGTRVDGISADAKWIWKRDATYVYFRKKISFDPGQLRRAKLSDSCSICGCPSGKACSNERCIEIVPLVDWPNFEAGMLQESKEACLGIANTDAKDFCLDYTASQKKDISTCSFISSDERQKWCEERARVFAAGKVIAEGPSAVGASGRTETTSDTSRATEEGQSVAQDVTIYPSEAYYCEAKIKSTQTLQDYLSTCQIVPNSELQKVVSKDGAGPNFKYNTGRDGIVFKFQLSGKTKVRAIVFISDGRGTIVSSWADISKLSDYSSQVLTQVLDSGERYVEAQVSNGELFLFRSSLGSSVTIDQIKITKTW
jgi:hypothetical protein